MIACFNGHIDVVRSLIGAHAYIHSQNKVWPMWHLVFWSPICPFAFCFPNVSCPLTLSPSYSQPPSISPLSFNTTLFFHALAVVLRGVKLVHYNLDFTGTILALQYQSIYTLSSIHSFSLPPSYLLSIFLFPTHDVMAQSTRERFPLRFS